MRSTLPFIILLIFASCKKDSNPSEPNNEVPLPVPDSIVLSHAEGQQWKKDYTYTLQSDDANHTYTVQEINHTTAPLPLGMVKRKFTMSADGKRVEKIFTQTYALHTGIPPIGQASMLVEMQYTGNNMAPDNMIVEAYTNVEGTALYSRDVINTSIIPDNLSKPFHLWSTTRVPELPGSTTYKEYLVQLKTDSIMIIRGDYDLTKGYFGNILPGNYGVEEFFNYFYLTADTSCTAFIFDRCWRETIHVANGNEWYYVYHPIVRKKANFTYDDNTPGLAAIFSRLDPAWFSPFRTMLHPNTLDDISPRTSTRTFFENICASYTDSIFTFIPNDVQTFHSTKRINNTVTLDDKRRIITMEKQGNVRYEFFYKE
jgi:hypothetical protein